MVEDVVDVIVVPRRPLLHRQGNTKMPLLPWNNYASALMLALISSAADASLITVQVHGTVTAANATMFNSSVAPGGHILLTATFDDAAPNPNDSASISLTVGNYVFSSTGAYAYLYDDHALLGPTATIDGFRIDNSQFFDQNGLYDVWLFGWLATTDLSVFSGSSISNFPTVDVGRFDYSREIRLQANLVNGDYSTGATMQGRADSYSISLATPISEPASLMLVGFGLIAIATRRIRKAVAHIGAMSGEAMA